MRVAVTRGEGVRRVAATFRWVRWTDGTVVRSFARRHTLRTVLSWCVDRQIFYEERDRVRAAFARNATLRDAGEIERALSDGEKTLESYAHPDPYIIPTMYGGSKYARNPEPPSTVGMVFDFGRESYTIPEGASSGHH